jgi:hypothetical protein
MTKDEKRIKALIAKLIMATPEEYRAAALDWIEKASEGENWIDRGLLALMIEGRAEITRVVDGDPSFRLTQKGLDSVPDVLARSPEARALLERLTGQAVVEDPGRSM